MNPVESNRHRKSEKKTVIYSPGREGLNNTRSLKTDQSETLNRSIENYRTNSQSSSKIHPRRKNTERK